jgi:hypothetical protein
MADDALDIVKGIEKPHLLETTNTPNKSIAAFAPALGKHTLQSTDHALPPLGPTTKELKTSLRYGESSMRSLEPSTLELLSYPSTEPS